MNVYKFDEALKVITEKEDAIGFCRDHAPTPADRLLLLKHWATIHLTGLSEDDQDSVMSEPVEPDEETNEPE